MTLPTDPGTNPPPAGTNQPPTQPPAGSATAPPPSAGTNAGGETPPGTDQTSPQNWDEYLEAQPDNVRTLYQEHTNGLRSALDSERQQRRDLERQLREISGQLDEGSQARQQIDRITGDLEQANQRADFYEDAAQAGVSNFRLAWLAVQDNPDEFTRRGRVQFDVLRNKMPELFRQAQPTTPPGHAGRGTQLPPAAPETMDTIIRKEAGVIK